MSRFKCIYLTLDAFTIARLGSDQLYAMAEEQLVLQGMCNIEILDMALKPVAIINDEVKYLCQILSTFP